MSRRKNTITSCLRNYEESTTDLNAMNHQVTFIIAWGFLLSLSCKRFGGISDDLGYFKVTSCTWEESERSDRNRKTKFSSPFPFYFSSFSCVLLSNFGQVSMEVHSYKLISRLWQKKSRVVDVNKEK